MSARLRQKRECRLTSISVGVTITGLLGGGGSRSSGSGTFAVVVVVVEDTSGRLGWGCRNVGGSRCSGGYSRAGSGSAGIRDADGNTSSRAGGLNSGDGGGLVAAELLVAEDGLQRLGRRGETGCRNPRRRAPSRSGRSLRHPDRRRRGRPGAGRPWTVEERRLVVIGGLATSALVLPMRTSTTPTPDTGEVIAVASPVVAPVPGPPGEPT